ncbi:hypothetical protein BDV96DRAFT_505443, partial [Lophiotrema nucula]
MTDPDTPVQPSGDRADPHQDVAAVDSQLTNYKWEELWTRAYDKLDQKAPDVTKEYIDNVSSMQGGRSAEPSAVLIDAKWIESVVTRLEAQRTEKQWRVNFSAKLFEVDIRLREQVENFLKLAMWSDRLVRPALNTQPHAALAWSGATIVISLIQDFMSQSENLLNGLDVIAKIQIYWRVCEQAFLKSDMGENIYRELKLQLIDIYALILEYQFRAINHLSKRAVTRGKSGIFGCHEWEARKQSITALDTEAKNLVPVTQRTEFMNNWRQQLDQIHKSNQILQGIQAILHDSFELQKKEAENDLLRALSGQPYSTSLFDIDDRVPDTFEWFYKDENRFKEWRDSRKSGILWISAGPGCGKSVLTKSLIKDGLLTTKRSTTNIAHFFFKEGDINRNSTSSAMCRLIHQILVQDPSKKLLQNASERGYTTDASLAKDLGQLWGILEDIVSSSDSGDTILVLDALDECSRTDRVHLLKILQEFFEGNKAEDSSIVLKVFITSRPYDDFKLGKPRKINPLAEYTTHIVFPNVSKDINLVIDARIRTIASEIPPTQREAISKHLRGRQDRTFLWLSLTFKYIEMNPDLFKRVVDIEQQLYKLPDGIFDAYGALLARVQDHKRSRVLLEIVYRADRPVSLLEANYALTIALASQKFESHKSVESALFPMELFAGLVRNCSGFMIDVFDGNLSFLHATAREFLETP